MISRETLISDPDLRLKIGKFEDIPNFLPVLDTYVGLLKDYVRLLTASKDVVRVEKRGADYNLAHPLARKDMPTDSYHLGKSMSEIKKT